MPHFPGVGAKRGRDPFCFHIYPRGTVDWEGFKQLFQTMQNKLQHSQINDRDIAWLDQGEGEHLILLHCSSASHKEWLSLIDNLPGNRFRILAPDLYGYGKSEPFVATEKFDARVDIEVIHHLLALSDRPVDIVAHSYGAAMAMEAMREQPEKVRRAILVEPVCFHLLKNTENCSREWRRADRVARGTARAARKGKALQATATYMRYWMGSLRWWLTPRKLKRKFVSSIDKVAAEFESVYEIKLRLEDYQCITSKVHLVYGEKTTAEAKKIIELLDTGLPDSDIHCIAGAGHMCPLTHSAQVNELVLRLLNA